MKTTLLGLSLFLVAPLLNSFVQNCEDTVRLADIATPAAVSTAPKCDAGCPSASSPAASVSSAPAAKPAAPASPTKSRPLPPGTKPMFM